MPEVPKLAVLKNLMAGCFSRALVECVMKARQIPNTIRSDRGPEMVSRVNAEVLAICGVRHIKGAALTPRHQGLGERGHQIVMNNHRILVNSVCEAFPQEWLSLLPTLEYLYDTAPQGTHGLSAHDMSCGYAMASSVDNKLVPFIVPGGMANTDVAARLFTNFSDLYWIFMRASRDAALRVQMRVNRDRNPRE